MKKDGNIINVKSDEKEKQVKTKKDNNKIID